MDYKPRCKVMCDFVTIVYAHQRLKSYMQLRYVLVSQITHEHRITVIMVAST